MLYIILSCASIIDAAKKVKYFSNVFDWINVHTSDMFSHLFNEEIVFSKSFSKICLIKTSQISLKSS